MYPVLDEESKLYKKYMFGYIIQGQKDPPGEPRMTRQEPARYIDPRTGRYHELTERRWRSDDGNPMMVTPLPASRATTSMRASARCGAIARRCPWRSTSR
jgi:hypothetical protein